MVVGRDERMVAGQQPAEGGHDGVEASFLADRHPLPGQGARRLAQPLAIAHRGDELAAVMAGAESQQLGDRRRPGDAVDRDAHVALKVAKSGRGEIAEDAVDPAGVETQGAQALLELGDVVPPQHGRPPVEEPVTESVPGLDQSRPGLRPTHPVDPKAPAVLERLDRRPGTGSELAPSIDAGGEPELLQAALDVGHGCTAHPDLEPDRLGGAHALLLWGLGSAAGRGLAARRLRGGRRSLRGAGLFPWRQPAGPLPLRP